MATAKSKSKPVAPAAGVSLNLVLLAAIATASASPPGYKHVSDADSAPLAAQGLVEVNPDPAFADPQGNKAVRISDAGLAHLNANAAAVSAAIAEAAAQSATPAPAAAPAAAAEKPSFNIVKGFQLPESKRGGGLVKRSESYPFGTMEIGDAFFIAANADKPNPERTFASTVASATNRYAVEDKSKPPRTNRKGRVVPELTYTRRFAIRRLEDGAAFGKPGVAGAVVGRIA